MQRLAGKRALITGGAGGIGSAIGKMFAEQAAQVVLSDIDEKTVSRKVAILKDAGFHHVYGLKHDVTNENEWTKVVAECESLMGGLNVLVNNAGIATIGNVEEISPQLWDKTMSVNLDSVYLGCRTCLPLLRQSSPASIINISSISGLIAGHNLAAYNASKAAVWMLTKSVALQAAREDGQVRCNSIHPAFIDTNMLSDVLGKSVDDELSDEDYKKFSRQIPLKRIGTVEDVAYAAVYLASDESMMMTGSEIKLDGGASAQ